jgi:hypothetical protein
MGCEPGVDDAFDDLGDEIEVGNRAVARKVLWG